MLRPTSWSRACIGPSSPVTSDATSGSDLPELDLELIPRALDQRLDRPIAAPLQALHGLGHEEIDLLAHLGRAEAGLQALHRGVGHVARGPGEGRVLEAAPQGLSQRILETRNAFAHALHGAGRRALARAVDEVLGDAAAVHAGQQSEGGQPEGTAAGGGRRAHA
jgi:hypothetical protein